MAFNHQSQPGSGLLSHLMNALERGRRRRRRGRIHARGSESLDPRLLLTVTTAFNAGVLTVSSDASDVISIAANGSGEVTVNGDNDPASIGAIAAADVTAIQVTGGDGDNVIDLSAVTSADYTGLTSVSINGGAGGDTITGSGFADEIHGGNGDDSVQGGAGDDTILGEQGNDTLAGGAGTDSIFGDANGSFADVQLMTNFGEIALDMRPDVAPLTVANFLDYAVNGDYDNVIFHRLATNFVLQGGGYSTPSTTFTSSAQFTDVPANAPVVNEFNLSNVRGTVAMAKLGGDPDSATNEFFFNLNDNSLNLDAQNGGFTVFAEVIDMTVIDDIVAASSLVNAGGAFNTLPLMNTDQLLVIQSVDVSGDDTILWSDGDGSDVVDGGGGSNVQQVITGGTDDTLAIADSAGTGEFMLERTSGTTFSIDGTRVTQLDLDAGDGADTVSINTLTAATTLTTINVDGSGGNDDISVTPTAGLTTNVDGGDPLSGVGDTFTFNATGTVTVSDTVNRAGLVSDGATTVSFSDFEDVQTADTRTLTISSESTVEGDSGTTTLNFSVSISNPQTQDITFDVSTADGTATAADSDFVALSGQLVTILAGQTTATATIDVNVNGDETNEADETFSLSISNVNAEAGMLSVSEGTGTIFNDDGILVEVDGNGNLAITEPDIDDANDLTVTFDSMSNEFVVSSTVANLTDGTIVGASELRFAASSVTGGLLATLNGGADRLDFSGIDLDATVSAGTGNDTIIGGGGNDQISGDDGDDNLRGGAGGDTIDGGAGNDTVLGNGGRDSLSGGAGDDTVRGHGGIDTLDGGAGIDRIDGGGSGNDLRDEVAGTAVITTAGYRTERGDIAVADGFFGRVAITGSAGDDRLDASGFDAANVTLNGGAGNDTLIGGKYNDVLLGGDGNDVLRGGAGRDRLFGEAGNDRLKGQGSIDQLSGGAGNDTLDGGGGGTILREDAGGTITLVTNADGTTSLTGVGTDRLIGAFARAIIVGGSGADTIDVSGFRGLATLVGGAGNDTLTGTQFDDVISGGDGNDSLIGLAGDDAIDGAAGNDFVSGGQGIDTLLGGDGNDTLRGGALQDFLLGEAGDDDVNGEELNDDQTGGGNGIAPSAGDVLTREGSRTDETNNALVFDFDRLLRLI